MKTYLIEVADKTYKISAESFVLDSMGTYIFYKSSLVVASFPIKTVIAVIEEGVILPR